MDLTLPELLVMLAVLALGWVIGCLDSNLRASKKIRAAERQARLQAEAAGSLLRLWRDAAQALRLDVDGQAVEPGALTAEQRSRVAVLLSQVRSWLEAAPASPPARASREGPEAPPAAAKTKKPKPGGRGQSRHPAGCGSVGKAGLAFLLASKAHSQNRAV